MTVSSAIFGKHPERGDFLRPNLTDDGIRALERWVNEANAGLGKRAFPSLQALWPRRPGWVVSAMAPSRDQVGRRYPIGNAMVATLVDGTPASTMAVASQRMLEASLEWLEASGRLTEAAVADGLAQVHCTTFELGAAEEHCRNVADNLPVQEIEARLFPGDEGARAYAYRTFAIAMESLREGRSLVVDCPIELDVDQFFWLSLAAHKGVSSPCVLWVESPRPRMLLGAQVPPPRSVAALVGNEDFEWLWPLTTSRNAAKAQALRSLGGFASVPGESLTDFGKRFADVGGAHG